VAYNARVTAAPAIFRFNQMRPAIVDEVARRVVDARVAAARAHPDESVAYVLNDLVIHELKRLRRVQPPDTPEDKRRVESIARALASNAPEEQLTALLDAQVRAYAEDIAGSFSVPAYRVASRILPSALSLLFTPQDLRRGLVSLGTLEGRIRLEGDLPLLRQLASDGVLVVVPTHLSNLDSPLVGFALERAGLPPMTYGAGKNLFTSPLTSFFMARLGAYKVDRRLRFGLYKDVLKCFSQVILEHGLHSIFFPGGTRSRSGTVERKLKLGLAGTALSAYIERLRVDGPRAPRYYFVPLTLNMPLVLEAETLIEDQLREEGKNRYIIEDDEFTRLGRVLTFAHKLLTMDQAIEVRFAAPRDPFGNAVDEAGRSRDGRGREIDPARYVLIGGEPAHHRGRDEEYTRELGARVAEDYLAATSYFATHLVAAVLFAELERQLPGLDLYRRLRHPREIAIGADALAARVERVRDAVEANAVRGLGTLAMRARGRDGRALVEDALASFSGYHTRAAAVRQNDAVVLGDRELILYYRNRLAHHAPALAVA
jgi:glycerol-3-phosphate O-acyltransferase